jgi:hypothetical protein
MIDAREVAEEKQKRSIMHFGGSALYYLLFHLNCLNKRFLPTQYNGTRLESVM